jgi:Tfp pilus assembly protein PilO
MNTTLTARGKIILSLILFIMICIIGYYGYLNLHTKPITAESQQQAETPAGISLAAHNAKVGMMQDQLDEAAKQIALLKNKKPDTIIQTVPYEVEKVVIKEVEKRGADFGIVADPQHPDKKVDLKEVEKLPASTPVTLNQYNVFAYKKVIRGINVYPKFTGIKPTGISEVTYDVSRKISSDGKYIGVVGGYEFEDRKAKIGLRYSF